jgi:hypothetical protein
MKNVSGSYDRKRVDVFNLRLALGVIAVLITQSFLNGETTMFNQP